MEKKIKFWDKVKDCKHEPNDKYLKLINCSTPYCSGYEWHCKHCGVFIIECGCGFCNSMSGWSEKKINSHPRQYKYHKK